MPSTYDLPRHTSIKLLSREAWERIDLLEGWLAFEAADFSYSLVQHQSAVGPIGTILELGVYKAKYLSALYFASRDSPLLGVDAFLQGIGNPLSPEDAQSAELLMRANVIAVNGEDSRLKILRADTMVLTPEVLFKHAGARLRLVHIDAGHEAANVMHDLALASALLHEAGVIVADDAFNFTTPGVPEGLFTYLLTQSNGQLAPFAYCGNKLFMCRPAFHASYLNFSKAFAKERQHFEYATKTLERAAINEQLGFTPTLFGFEVFPFVEISSTDWQARHYN
jgi:hypothetical protein